VTIFLISGSGQGAGKTTLAHKLVGERFTYSLAGTLRNELKRLHPEYDWHNKTQAYKDNTQVTQYLIKSPGDPFRVLSLRQVLQEYGQEKCKNDPCHWVKKLVAKLVMEPGLSVIAVDDVRKICELEVLKQAFPNTYHMHIKHSSAIHEPIYESAELEEVADYVIYRK
jgi:hypothetical protein